MTVSTVQVVRRCTRATLLLMSEARRFGLAARWPRRFSRMRSNTTYRTAALIQGTDSHMATFGYFPIAAVPTIGGMTLAADYSLRGLS